MSWRTLDHTADVALEVRAERFPALLDDAARAFGELVSGGSAPADAPRVVRALALAGADHVECWVRFWRECLRLWTVAELLVVDATVDRAVEERPEGGPAVRARVVCVPAGALDPARCTDVKAVTWHAAEAEERGGHWLGTIVLDL
jgi:SHS2 domain-containing protein